MRGSLNPQDDNFLRSTKERNTQKSEFYWLNNLWKSLDTYLRALENLTDKKIDFKISLNQFNMVLYFSINMKIQIYIYIYMNLSFILLIIISKEKL